MNKIDLDPFKKYLIKRIKHQVFNGKKLFAEIKDQSFLGSYTTLYRYLKQDLSDYWQKPTRKNTFYRATFNHSGYKPAIRFETEPGQQAQVDWGYFGKVTLNNREEKLYCFVFVLSYSRMLYLEFTTKMALPVFENCHINAFKVLGIPDSIVYDNTKTVVRSRERLPDGSKKVSLNQAFLDFANYYGFEIIVSPPYWPRNKGKVEASVKYVRNNFFQGFNLKRNFSSLEQLNLQAQSWIEKVANSRLHATTKEKPLVRWNKERSYLKFPNNFPDYQVTSFLTRFSTKDQHVQYKQNFYSVPKKYAWKKLLIREIHEQGNTFIRVYSQNQLVAEHILSTEKSKRIEKPEHFQTNTPQISLVKDNKKSRRWQEYPEISVRPLSYYDQLTSESYE